MSHLLSSAYLSKQGPACAWGLSDCRLTSCCRLSSTQRQLLHPSRGGDFQSEVVPPPPPPASRASHVDSCVITCRSSCSCQTCGAFPPPASHVPPRPQYVSKKSEHFRTYQNICVQSPKYVSAYCSRARGAAASLTTRHPPGGAHEAGGTQMRGAVASVQIVHDHHHHF